MEAHVNNALQALKDTQSTETEAVAEYREVRVEEGLWPAYLR